MTLIPNDAWGGEGCLGCDIGYGYLHRIPVSVDRSEPVQDAMSKLSISNQEPPKANVAQPGFTGIPQVDGINQVSTASVAVTSKDFPDPSEFLVNLPPASNTANVTSPPNISTPQAPLTSTFISTLNDQSFQNVASTAPSYAPPTNFVSQVPVRY